MLEKLRSREAAVFGTAMALFLGGTACGNEGRPYKIEGELIEIFEAGSRTFIKTDEPKGRRTVIDYCLPNPASETDYSYVRMGPGQERTVIPTPAGREACADGNIEHDEALVRPPKF